MLCGIYLGETMNTDDQLRENDMNQEKAKSNLDLGDADD